jgi:hypothetical protein
LMSGVPRLEGADRGDEERRGGGNSRWGPSA